MADRLGLGPEVRQLKLGTTFTNSRTNAFHSIRYDFKPASVDVTKKATVDVGNNNQVTVTVPHLDGAGIPQTLFKGSQKPYQKECVLIIDRVTGEITLEKLSSNIQVKKTRSESYKTPSISHNSNRPQTPIDTPQLTQRTSSKTKVTSGSRRNPNPIGLIPKHSPLRASPSHHPSPSHNHKIDRHSNSNNSNNDSASHSALASLPIIGLDDISEPPQTTSGFRQPSPLRHSEEEPNGVGILSDSSSSSSSDSSSDSDSEPEKKQTVHSRSQNNGTFRTTNGRAPNLSMPDHLLNEDLCLSESSLDSN